MYLGLAIFCIKRSKAVLMKVSMTFQFEQYILRALVLSLKSTHLPMMQPPRKISFSYFLLLKSLPPSFFLIVCLIEFIFTQAAKNF